MSLLNLARIIFAISIAHMVLDLLVDIFPFFPLPMVLDF
jgi:hypothetical protein